MNFKFRKFIEVEEIFEKELGLGLGRRVIQGEAKQIVPRDCSARKVSGTCVIFFVGSGPRATRPL